MELKEEHLTLYRRFKYLRALVSYNICDNLDVHARIANANTAMGKLKSFWRDNCVDGLHLNWENGVRSDWETMYKSSISRHSEMRTPFIIARLNRRFDPNSPVDREELDLEEKTHMSNICEKYTVERELIVSMMPLPIFR